MRHVVRHNLLLVLLLRCGRRGGGGGGLLDRRVGVGGAGAGHVALDGAPLRTAPEDHTVYCMRDIPACRVGGFGILERIYETPPPPPPLPPSAATAATEAVATDAAEEEEDLEPPPTNLLESELQSAPPPFYFLKYRLDAAGNALALELLDATVKVGEGRCCEYYKHHSITRTKLTH